jgi:squalene synthase HpnC
LQTNFLAVNAAYTHPGNQFPDGLVRDLRRVCQVTAASLFAFISGLCPNRQVTREAWQVDRPEVGAGAGAQADTGSSDTENDGTGVDGAGESRAGGEDDRMIAAQVSLAVAAKASAENFPVALRVLPKRWRVHLSALYGFARLVDDIGDEPLPGLPADTRPAQVTATRLKLLDDLEADVRRLYADQEPELQIVRDLGRSVKECAIPAQPLYDLIQANRQDQIVTRYDTYQDLVAYCRLSANPVGQVVLAIMGAATPERIAASDSICTALQVIEHSQDVAEDLANGRIYLPKQDMDAYGVTEDDLAQATANRRVKDLVKFESDRARQALDEGSPLVGTLNGMARLAIAGYVAGGRATLKAIQANGYDVLRNTPRPGKADTLAMMTRCYVKGR